MEQRDYIQLAARRQAFDADVYLCTANALTMAGEIVEIDGTGNRVGALIFGPEKIIVVAAENKLTLDVERGIAQIKKNVCPGNGRIFPAHKECEGIPCDPSAGSAGTLRKHVKRRWKPVDQSFRRFFS